MPADWQMEYGGLTIGDGTSYGLISVKGLNRTDSREDVQEITGEDGAFVFAHLVVERRIEISADVIGTPGSVFEGLIDALEAAFAPILNATPLTWKWAGAATKTVNCVPSKFVYDVTPQYGIGYAEWSVLLVAGDPTIT